jgi:hypothetical protein
MRKAFFLSLIVLSCSNPKQLHLENFELAEMREYYEGQLDMDLDTSSFKCLGDSLNVFIRLHEKITKEPFTSVTLVRQNGERIDSFELKLNGWSRLTIPFDCKSDTLIIQNQSYVRRFFFLGPTRKGTEQKRI